MIIRHFDDSTDMYIIAKGEVEVCVIDESKHRVLDRRILMVGDYFGEISLIYQCKRTAEVTSRKYSTFAKLTKQQYKDLAFEFPALNEQLKEGIYKYNDKMKMFLKKTLLKLEYLKDISEDAFHDILYGFKTEMFE